MADKITIAVSKGRIFDEAIPLLAKIDVIPKEDPKKSRRLIIETNQSDIQILVIRATDVPTYVERGAAALGIAGKDVLLEYQGDGFYEPFDLGIAKCQMMLAGLKKERRKYTRPRIATKYANVTQSYFANFGQQVEIIKLYGSMELAPTLSMCRRIVDLVSTGKTLIENGLSEVEEIMKVQSKLIVNRSSFKTNTDIVQKIIEELKNIIL